MSWSSVVQNSKPAFTLSVSKSWYGAARAAKSTVLSLESDLEKVEDDLEKVEGDLEKKRWRILARENFWRNEAFGFVTFIWVQNRLSAEPRCDENNFECST